MKKDKTKVDELSLKKLKKIFKITLIACVFIIILEVIGFTLYKNSIEKKNVYFDSYNATIKDGDSYLAVGSSYFKNSKYNEYTKGIEKGKFVKYDENGKILFEIQYDKGINSTFTSILELEDGYLITGHAEYDEYQTENKTRDAFIIKFDKNGNNVWEKYYSVLSDTRFNKAILLEDGIIVIGRSIYENMEVGNHSTGGGIIVKYDFEGNEIWHANHGGNKSGNFNGIVEVDGDLYVTGKDGADSGNIVKFDKNGEYKWHKNYSYTDNEGLKDIIYFNKKLYVVGSKKILTEENQESRKTTNTDGVILVYDLKGKLKEEVTFGGTSYERFNGIIELNDNIYITGISASNDIKDLKIELNQSENTITSGILLKYDKELNLLKSNVLGGTNNDQMLKIQISEDEILVNGYSNSKDGTIKTKENNGKDYFGKIIKTNEMLEINIIK